MFLSVLQAALYKNLDGVNGLAYLTLRQSGCIAIFWGLLGLLIILYSPSITRAFWLSKIDRALAIERIRDHGTETSKLIDGHRLGRKL
ncbi:hypothetical protein MAP00_008195 [Monascus purpureus]|nr:hypothetical protein MAP00_008195 [Monascus purpureus]